MIRQILFASLLAFTLSGCSFPRVIVLHDPLAAEEHVRLGSIYRSQGKIALARDQYRMAVELDKKDLQAWALLGEVSYELKEYREAEKAYERALDLDPKSGDLHNNLAWVYVAQDRKLGKASELADKAMELSPDHRPYYLDTRGMILLKLGKTQEAITAFRESVDTLPKDQPGPLSEAYLHLSEAYQAAGDEPAAKEALQSSQSLAEKH